VPGASLHDELAWLTRAGLTPFEALRAATVNSARLVSADASLGSLRPGMLADLVVLSDNPRRDIRAVASIVAVLKDGRVVFQRD
jgi:imidazolonepropionase-like amidohydrolase